MSPKTTPRAPTARAALAGRRWSGMRAWSQKLLQLLGPRRGRTAAWASARMGAGRMDVRLGIFVVPDATDPAATLAQIVAADESGLDIVGVQDHPYQWRFFDTWTLLAYAAGRTERVRLVPDVLNLPLRPPAMVAKSAAS